MTRIAGGIARQRDPRPRRVPRQLPLRPRPHAAEARGAAARAVRRPRRAARSTRNAPSGPVAHGEPARRRARRRRRAGARAQAGLDAGRRVRPRRPRRGQLRARASPRRRTGATSRSRSPRSCAHTSPGARSRHEALPRRSTGMQTYPFVRLTDAKRAARGRGRGPDRLRHRRAARGDAGLHPRGARRRDRAALHLPARRRAAGAARRDRGWVERRFGARLDPDTQVVPTLGSKEAIFHLAQVLGGDLVAVPAPGYPVYERGAVFAGKQVSSCRCATTRGFLPDLDAVPPPPGSASACSGSTTRTTRPARDGAARALRARGRAGAGARLRARLRRGVLARSTSAASRPSPRCSSPTCANVAVLNTLSKRSSMPGYRSGLRGRRPGR